MQKANNGKLMNIDELWIGDTIRIKSSLKVGTYEGQAKDGRLRVKYHGKILLVTLDNIEPYVIPDQKLIPTYQDIPIPKESLVKKSIQFQPEIDLHIETLNPTLENEAPQIILNHQIVKCTQFIQEAIRLNIKIILIIHGKGTGQLKREVDFILSDFHEVRFALPKHNGGATEVWLK